jgi:hypothetical protein
MRRRDVAAAVRFRKLKKPAAVSGAGFEVLAMMSF